MKKIACMVFLMITLFVMAEEKKYLIKRIKYLTPEVLNENVMRTYLGFNEGDTFTIKELAFYIETARLRLKNYGIFNTVEILEKDSVDTENSKVIFISLSQGFNNTINAGLWWGNVGWKNIAQRGDYIGFFAGINKNELRTLTTLPPGFIYFEQLTGWSFGMDNPFFPFFPLYGNENKYEHTLYSILNLGIKVHPDIVVGFRSGIKNYFTSQIVNLSNIETTYYDFSYNYSVIPVGGFLTVDMRYLAEKWYSGFIFSLSPSANIDILNKQVFPEIVTNLRGGLFPHSYISLVNDIQLYSTILSLYPGSARKSVRGELSNEESSGNFTFVNKVDFRVKIIAISMGSLTSEYGLTSFYEGVLAGNDFAFSELNYNSIVGGGFYIRLGFPVNLTIFGELGYTVGKEFEDGYKINIGLGDFF